MFVRLLHLETSIQRSTSPPSNLQQLITRDVQKTSKSLVDEEILGILSDKGIRNWFLESGSKGKPVLEAAFGKNSEPVDLSIRESPAETVSSWTKLCWISPG